MRPDRGAGGVDDEDVPGTQRQQGGRIQAVQLELINAALASVETVDETSDDGISTPP
ncbi:hypothetical protein [Rhodococcus opacus]|uniref:hypothetical protein n=1 Tax=Rhodococcus opacus TaxID=37919 RepID=UPI002955D927|nr:hypothetical protein [Rhodococcus opacus]MDV7088363.1 hypothetical protein [Rhodococcus opacus]